MVDETRPWTMEDQRRVDAVVHYRNLAIQLGAKPDYMLNKWDRSLAARGIDDDPDDDMPPMWAEALETEQALERAEARVKALEAALRPFARLAETNHLKNSADDVLVAGHFIRTEDGTWEDSQVSVGDCRRARRALGQEGESYE